MPFSSEVFGIYSYNFRSYFHSFGSYCYFFGSYSNKWERNFARKMAGRSGFGGVEIASVFNVFAIIYRKGNLCLYFRKKWGLFRKEWE